MIQTIVSAVCLIITIIMFVYLLYRLYLEFFYRPPRKSEYRRTVPASHYERNWIVPAEQAKLYWDIQHIAYRFNHAVLMRVPASLVLRVKETDKDVNSAMRKLRSTYIDFLICDERLRPRVAVYSCIKPKQVNSSSWMNAALQFNGIEVLYVTKLDAKTAKWLEHCLSS